MTGTERAAERLAEHRKKWDGVDLTPIPSRQAKRAEARRAAKAELHTRKVAAMRAREIGGSAAVF